MHGLQEIIINNQKAVNTHIELAKAANKGKTFETNVAQDKALNAIKSDNR